MDEQAQIIEALQSQLKEERARTGGLVAEIESLRAKTESLRAEVFGITKFSRRRRRFLRRMINGWYGYDAAYYVWKQYKKKLIGKNEALRVIGFTHGLCSFFLLYPLYKAVKPLVKCKKHLGQMINRARQFWSLNRYKLREIAPETISFQSTEGTPEVSVIIPSYGHVLHTLNCLASIAHNLPRRSIEIIIVEDASGDSRTAKLRRVSGISLVENQMQMGFLWSCNSAARQARAPYLYFLNNDTFVEPGAIDALVDFVERTPDAGLVGSRLVNPHGFLQDAGCIVWDDASVVSYGSGDDPGKPQYQYVREVDFVAGASMLVPRTVWEELNGFDKIFSPAYHEDADFAFRVRALGKKVYFQPLSVVCHFRGVSYKNEASAHVAVNRRMLLKRWGDLLREEHYPEGQHLLRARDRSKHRPVILFVDHHVPAPDLDAGSPSTFEFIRSLRIAGWNVKFWPEELRYDQTSVPPLQQLGVEVLYAPYEKSLAGWLARNGSEIDYVLLSGASVTLRCVDVVRHFTNAPVLYCGVDLKFARMRREAAMKSDRMLARAADEMEKTERLIWRSADAVLYPSQEEVDVVSRLEPETSAHCAPIYCFDDFQPRAQAPTTSTIVFVADFAYPPNVDAAIWFIQEVFPCVKNRRPETSLSLVGASPTADVQQFAGPGIEVTRVISSDELAACYANSRVAVAPLRFGAGVKLKVIEPMVQGVPLVTTPVGAQGLIGIEHVVPVTEDARTFSEHVIRRLESTDEEWLEQSHKQLDYAKKNFSRQNQIDSLLGALQNARRVYKLSW